MLEVSIPVYPVSNQPKWPFALFDNNDQWLPVPQGGSFVLIEDQYPTLNKGYLHWFGWTRKASLTSRALTCLMFHCFCISQVERTVKMFDMKRKTWQHPDFYLKGMFFKSVINAPVIVVVYEILLTYGKVCVMETSTVSGTARLSHI